MNRKRLFEIIEVGEEGGIASRIYGALMMITIIISLLPLTIKYTTPRLKMIDQVTVTVFVIDYFLRLLTADYKINKGKRSFVRYPFTLMALVDLVSVLPSFIVINKGLKLLKVTRLVRTFRVFRVFKSFRYSKNIDIIFRVFRKQKDNLMVVCALAFGYILISALLMFNVEPETFPTFFDAIYWSTVSLTTVGYGDIYAVSDLGKIITMISALFGIAIVALPAGIITAGYMEEIEDSKKEKE